MRLLLLRTLDGGTDSITYSVAFYDVSFRHRPRLCSDHRLMRREVGRRRSDPVDDEGLQNGGRCDQYLSISSFSSSAVLAASPRHPSHHRFLFLLLSSRTTKQLLSFSVASVLESDKDYAPCSWTARRTVFRSDAVFLTLLLLAASLERRARRKLPRRALIGTTIRDTKGLAEGERGTSGMENAKEREKNNEKRGKEYQSQLVLLPDGSWSQRVHLKPLLLPGVV